MQTLIEKIQQGIDLKRYPGATVAIINNDDVQCYALGMKSVIEHTIENKVDTIYDLASLSKVLSTTPIILHLIDQHVIRFDTQISEYRPSFLHTTTVESLLLHTSGLPSDVNVAGISCKEDLLTLIDQQELQYTPYTDIVYSDLGYILLGDLIERVCHQSLEDVFNEVIKQPLSLQDTYYHVPDDKKNRCAPTEYKPHRGMVSGEVHDGKAFIMGGVGGSAGLFSTLLDVVKMVQAYLGENAILTQPCLANLKETKISINGQSRTWGWIVKKPGILYHTGFTGTSILMDMNQNRAIIWLTNQVHYGREIKPIFNQERDSIMDEVINEWM